MIEKAIEIAKSRSVPPRRVRPSFYRITAILTNKKGRILSIGLNSYSKTHPRQKVWLQRYQKPRERVFLHAEMDAIISCDEIEQAHSIFVAAVTRGGNLTLARPCEEICYPEIRWNTNVKYVYFTTRTGEVAREKVDRS